MSDIYSNRILLKIVIIKSINHIFSFLNFLLSKLTEIKMPILNLELNSTQKFFYKIENEIHQLKKYRITINRIIIIYW